MGVPSSLIVKKANSLIQKSRFSLSLQEQRIILYLISMISESDKSFKEYEFDIAGLCAVCGLDARSGKHYQDIKAALQKLRNESMWVDIDGVDTLIYWIEKPRINKRTGKITVRLDSDMMPFLLQLKSNFTQYELRWILQFRSKYSSRLYELIKSVYFKPLDPYTYEFTLAFLRDRMDAANYKTWQDFKVRALEPAIEEINRHSDLTISYTPIKIGRTVEKIRVAMETKDVAERVRMSCQQSDQLYQLLCEPTDQDAASSERSIAEIP